MLKLTTNNHQFKNSGILAQVYYQEKQRKWSMLLLDFRLVAFDRRLVAAVG